MLFLFVLALILLSVLFGNRGPKPLSAIEAKLVGEWRQKGTSEDDHGRPFWYSSDRIFRTSDGEFKGRWWVEDNKLHVKYWRDEPQNAVMEMIREYRTHAEVWTFRIDEPNEQIIASELGGNFECTWIRVKRDGENAETPESSTETHR